MNVKLKTKKKIKKALSNMWPALCYTFNIGYKFAMLYMLYYITLSSFKVAHLLVMLVQVTMKGQFH